MKKKILIAIASLVALAHLPAASAATVPAGTVIVVQTLEALTSTDVPGTRVPTRLLHNVTANGKVMLPAGTRFAGKVETSRRTVHSTQRLTVNLTAVEIGGRVLPITTTGAYLVDNQNFKTKHGTSVSRVGYSVPVGRHLHFKLAQPLHL
ncbi:MAG: hypothetical protein DMF06_14070 [Verrucomicrobia bacterium]|nr:MAG: hypothetical protein DMF06_14070 [Verrucomicrobiota bacterium]